MLRAMDNLLSCNDIFRRTANNPGKYLPVGYVIVLFSGSILGLYNWLQSPYPHEWKAVIPFVVTGAVTFVLLHTVMTVLFWAVGKAFGENGSFMAVARALGVAFAPMCALFIIMDIVFVRYHLWSINVLLSLVLLVPGLALTHYSFTKTLIVSHNVKPWKAQICSAWIIFFMGTVFNMMLNIKP